jgi:hypothetical protein
MGVLYASCRSHRWATVSVSSMGEGAVEPSVDIYSMGVELARRGRQVGCKMCGHRHHGRRVGESGPASQEQDVGCDVMGVGEVVNPSVAHMR